LATFQSSPIARTQYVIYNVHDVISHVFCKSTFRHFPFQENVFEKEPFIFKQQGRNNKRESTS